MQYIKTELVQREFDKRWEKIALIRDHENSYSFTNEQGIRTTLIPEKWITVEVFDFLMEETPCQT